MFCFNIITLHSDTRFGLRSVHFNLGVLRKRSHEISFLPIRAICNTHLILNEFNTLKHFVKWTSLKLLSFLFSPHSCYFMFSWSECSSQLPDLKHTQYIMSSLKMTNKLSDPHKRADKIMHSLWFDLYVFGEETGRQNILSSDYSPDSIRS